MIYAMGNDAVRITNSRIWETLEKIFFGLFLFSIPLQTRLIFVSQETYRYGFFNEYTTFFLYLSDILIIITLFLFFVNPVQKFTKQVTGLIFLKIEKSLPFDNTTRKFSFGVNPLTKKVNFSEILKTKLSTYPLFIPILAFFLLIAWEFLSIYWSEYKEISFFKSLKLAEFGLLLFYISQRLRWFGLVNFLGIIFVAGFFQSIVGILQYLYQHSLGLKILGESILAPNIDNVAKIIVDGEKLIRAYGTLPHPNVFAGFLILSIFSGFWLLFTAKIEKNGLLWISILTAGITLQLMVIVLSFSRVGWLATLLTLIILLLSKTQLFHPPMYSLKLFHVKQFILFVLAKLYPKGGILRRAGVKQFIKNGLNKPKFISFVIILTSFLVFLALNRNSIISRGIDTTQNYQQTISHRTLYNNIARKVIKDQPLTGIGSGNFTLKMKDYSPITLEWWQYQPVHNIYLLITSELGTVGLILFLFFIFSLLIMAYLKQKENYGFHPPTFLLKLFHACPPKLSHFLQKSFNLKQNSAIVSRETFLRTAKEGETTIYNKTQASEIILLNWLLFAVFIGFLFIGLFDHYFWTLQQGQLTFWLTIGVLMASTGMEQDE